MSLWGLHSKSFIHKISICLAVTEREIINGILKVKNTKNHCLGYVRYELVNPICFLLSENCWLTCPIKSFRSHFARMQLICPTSNRESCQMSWPKNNANIHKGTSTTLICKICGALRNLSTLSIGTLTRKRRSYFRICATKGCRINWSRQICSGINGAIYDGINSTGTLRYTVEWIGREGLDKSTHEEYLQVKVVRD